MTTALYRNIVRGIIFAPIIVLIVYVVFEYVQPFVSDGPFSAVLSIVSGIGLVPLILLGGGLLAADRVYRLISDDRS